MEPEKHIEFTQSGIKCDNPECNWRDDNVKAEDYKDWIDKPCPNCEANLLTQEDYESGLKFEAAVDFINTLSIEELEQMGKLFDMEDVVKLPIFKDAEGLDKLFTEDKITATVESHKGIRITSIQADDTEPEGNSDKG